MYYYVYDDFVQDKKYERDLSRIENRLADLGIAGKIARLALFKHAGELIIDEVRRGVKTVVAVGDDSTVYKVFQAVAESGATLAVIPFGRENNLARILGIPEGEAACDVIANRLTEKFDIGLINGERFLTGVRFNGINPEIVCDKSFIVTPTEPTAVEVRNLAVGNVASSDDVSDPQDGRLDLVVANKGKGGFWKRRKQAPATVLPLKRFAFDSKRDAVAEVDGRKIRDTRFRVRLDAKKIKVIVGKDRMF